MVFIATPIKGLYIIEPKVFKDDRGYFFESFNQESFLKHIDKIRFVQDNESSSSYGVIRGLHFQKPPFAQAKLIRCVKGKILDVAVDIRKNSPTFGRHLSIILSGDNKKQLYVPRGFAHGFGVLSKKAIVNYKVDNFYAPDHDSGIIWNDECLQIDWGIPLSKVIISEKDNCLQSLFQSSNYF